MTDSSQQVLSASDDTAATVAELQFTTGTGPCIDAFAEGGPVLTADLSDIESAVRWPVFAVEAAESGAKAIFSFPLQVGAIRLGVLALYCDEPGRLSSDAITEALIAADIVCLALLSGLSAEGDGDGETGSDWMDHGPYDHREVHQATGMLMARLDVTAKEALSRLRALAFTEGQLLTEIAAAVVARTIQLDND